MTLLYKTHDCSLQEREVDTADAPALNITTHYTYNSIPSEAQAKVSW